MLLRMSLNDSFYQKKVLTCTLAPNVPEKWGCRMGIQDLFSKIRDLFSNTRLRDQKNSRCS